MTDLPPVPWVRERDLDLLLAELFATEPEFTSWLLRYDQRHAAEIPHESPESVHAVINYSRPDASSSAGGESDVLVTASYRDGDLVLSIENKVWAAPQTDQGRRHRNYVEESPARWGLAVLIGPDAWIRGHPNEADFYHLIVPLEEIASWCRTHSFVFRAAVFEQACRPTHIDLAPDLQDWHSKVDRLFADEFDLRLARQRFVRTRNPGQARPNRWPSFAIETLARPHGAEQPWVILKPASANHTSRAALQLAKAPEQIVGAVRQSAASYGLGVRVTPKGTLIVENCVASAHTWVVSAAFEEQVPHLISVGRAAVQLRTWWNALVQAQGWFVSAYADRRTKI